MIRIALTALFSLALLVAGAKLQPNHHFTSTANTVAAAQPDDEGSGGGTDPDTVEQGPDGDGNVEG